MRIFFAVGLLAVSTVLAGCATSRSEIALASPTAAGPKAPSNGRTVVIRHIKDERVFEQAPGEPSTPSLGLGGVAQATDAVKARAIARKRNGYGQALGDVVLPEGRTVVGLVRENLTAAFEQAGYRVASAEQATAPPLTIVDVSIRKFWAWMRPGFWALTFNTNVETVLTPVGGTTPTTVSVTVEEPPVPI